MRSTNLGMEGGKIGHRRTKVCSDGQLAVMKGGKAGYGDLGIEGERIGRGFGRTEVRGVKQAVVMEDGRAGRGSSIWSCTVGEQDVGEQGMNLDVGE